MDCFNFEVHLRGRYFVWRWRFLTALAAWALRVIKFDLGPHVGWADSSGKGRWHLYTHTLILINLDTTLQDIESVRALLRGVYDEERV